MLLTSLIIISFMLSFASGFAYLNRAHEIEVKRQRGYYEQLLKNMKTCANIAKRMTYAGADIQFSLYPEIKPYLYATMELNDACHLSYGESVAPISRSLSKKIQDTENALLFAYATGQDAKQIEKAFSEYILLFNEIILSRF